ncbi:MAG TPA: hypothetical protein VHG93_04490, partial [Longimicrobium sp.]|nr:hypothetical protein [Longimicrobium sp.]
MPIFSLFPRPLSMAFLDTRRQRAGLLVALLGVAIAIALAPFATGLLGIVVLYVICAPAHRRLSRVIPPRLSAFVVLTVALVLVLLPLGVMVSVIVAEAPDTIAAVRANADRLSTLRIGGMDVGAHLAAAGGTAVAWVSEQAIGFFGSAARSLLSLVIAFFGLYYLLLYPGRSSAPTPGQQCREHHRADVHLLAPRQRHHHADALHHGVAGEGG